MIDDFIYLSRILTGEDDLDFVLAEQYFQRLSKETPTDGLAAVLERFRRIRESGAAGEAIVEAVREQIIADATLKTVAQQIIYLWYTGAVRNAGKITYGSADQYFSGLFWKVARAHTPMLSGGYFGYWKYPPEN